MKTLLFLITTHLFISCSQTQLITPRPDSNYRFSILQGSTTDTSTVMRIIYPEQLNIQYTVKDSKGKIYPVKRIKSFNKPHSPFTIEHIKISGLSTKKSYTLNVDSDKELWKDKRTFKTLDTDSKDLNILVASCMSDFYNEIGNELWPKAFAHRPDVTFLIGDNIYADTFSGVYLGSDYLVTPTHLWNRYVDHAMTMKLYRMKHLTPTYVTWDDHDYGKNDGGEEYIYKKQAREYFDIFFAREKSENLSFGPGVSSRLELAGMNFLFLDGRSFREDRKKKSAKHFGVKQRAWIKKNIQPDKLNWLISGDQFFGGYHEFESFQGNRPESFKDFLNDLSQTKAKFVFISGDRHLIEVMKVPKKIFGQKTFEYTISGMHTKMYPGSLDYSPNPLRVDGFDGLANYALFKTKTGTNKVHINFQGHSSSKLELDHNQEINFQKKKNKN